MCVRVATFWLFWCAATLPSGGDAADAAEQMTYRRFRVTEEDGQVASIQPLPDAEPPLWASRVSQQSWDWKADAAGNEPLFVPPIPFVLPPPEGSGEPFFNHNHQPAITWCPNGDLLAIWYTTKGEQDPLLTVLASRLRAGGDAWDPSSEFFKAADRNMHGSAVFHDGEGTLFHFNGMAPERGRGWSRLALLLRTSTDNGVSWSVARPISSGAAFVKRNQVIAGPIRMKDGTLVLACDATPGGEGPSAIHVSRDGSGTWADPGGDIRGIHAGVAEIAGGALLAFGRAQPLDGKMPISVSADLGKTWTYRPSPFPPIGSGQRLVLLRLAEGPLLLVSFTSAKRKDPGGIEFPDREGGSFIGRGMFAALSFDDGETWPVRKLLTPGSGTYAGGAHTGTFTASPTFAEPAGYLAATQSPDSVIHLISSRLHYRFNLAWLEEPARRPEAVPTPPHDS